jgi:DNA-directed RNA polymerase specialized sigma subunit
MSEQRINKHRLLGILEIHSAKIGILSTKQAALVKLFLSVKNYSTIAKMAGVNEATVARRLEKIANRLSSANPPAGICQNDSPPAETIEIINDYFINGLNVKTIAKKTGLSRYRITKTIKQMRKL